MGWARAHLPGRSCSEPTPAAPASPARGTSRLVAGKLGCHPHLTCPSLHSLEPWPSASSTPRSLFPLLGNWDWLCAPSVPRPPRCHLQARACAGSQALCGGNEPSPTGTSRCLRRPRSPLESGAGGLQLPGAAWRCLLIKSPGTRALGNSGLVLSPPWAKNTLESAPETRVIFLNLCFCLCFPFFAVWMGHTVAAAYCRYKEAFFTHM